MNYDLLSEAGVAAVIAGADPELVLERIVFGDWEWLDDLSSSEVGGGYCKRGHAWTEENTHIRPNGWRMCRECARQAEAARRERGRERRKVPCVHCGEPALAPSEKRTKAEPRCRTCYRGFIQRQEAAA